MTLNRVTIRRATGDDLDTILSLNQRLFEHDGPFDSALDFSFPRSAAGQEYFRKRIMGADSIALVADMANISVGYLVGAEINGEAYRNVGKLAELENMLVADNVRCQGVGGRLVAVFVDWCKERNLRRIKVSAYSGNAEALRFYEKNGFQRVSVSMEKEI